MEIEPKLPFTTLFAALSTSVAAIAAEDMGKDMVMPGDAKIEKAAP